MTEHDEEDAEGYEIIDTSYNQEISDLYQAWLAKLPHEGGMRAAFMSMIVLCQDIIERLPSSEATVVADRQRSAMNAMSKFVAAAEAAAHCNDLMEAAFKKVSDGMGMEKVWNAAAEQFGVYVDVAPGEQQQ